MTSLYRLIVPTDPPYTPMTFTRYPVLHRFWGAGLLAAAVGFGLGFMLWLWQYGADGVPDDYFTYRLWHARIQIELFTGSILMGFAFQAGPHVVGGTPAPSDRLLRLLPTLWLGLILSLTADPVLSVLGQVLVTAAYAGAAYYMFNITSKGNPKLRISRGFPLAAGFLPLAASPWLPLEEPEAALLMLWCGPVTIALAAGQQLINNVLGGTLLQGISERIYAVSLVLAWLVSGLATFVDSGFWQLAGVFWLIVIVAMVIGTGFLGVAAKFGFKAINVTLILGFGAALACGVLMVVQGEDLVMDGAVHLLGVGVVTTLIIGVVARVAAFFSAGAALPDRVVVYLLILWAGVALARTGSSMGWFDTVWVLATTHIGTGVLLAWGLTVGYRLTRITPLLPPEMKQQKQEEAN
ncbi:MAG: NnrS family protein [Magnetococcales bacterium]|nr:NnrS family protein [Magnetococcales bacterium]